MNEDKTMELFFELFSGLPRQGPGGPDSTLRALSLVPPLHPGARILDVGCGTGAQSFDLARFSPVTVVGVDLHAPYIDELNARASESLLADRIRGQVGDMGTLDFPAAHFDLIWCEGAIYFLGIEAGLVAWRPLLKPAGHVAFTELCWLVSEPPEECVRYFETEYPAMCDVPAHRASIERAGYALIDDFVLPSSAWWTDYYDSLQKNLEIFRERHADDPVADAVAEQSEREMEMHRRYSDAYGYVFFVARRDDD